MKKKNQAITVMAALLAAGMLASCGSTNADAGKKESTQTEQNDGIEKAEERIEEAFTENGITDFEKLDLSEYEQQAGVALVDDYISYHFFYESDGLAIEAYLAAPRELLEQESLTDCLIYNHGGNKDYGALEGVETTFYAYQYQTICVASNYRGCGKSEGTDTFGGQDVDDVIHLIDLCEKMPFIDGEYINMLGVSRGGMMTYEALRADDRIHRAVVVSGLADCFMEYEERDDMKEVYQELVGGTPQQMPEEYEKRSATYWADQINTPLLIFHSESDDRVSIAQAEELAAKLEAAGKEYQLISHETGGHGELTKEDVKKIRQWFSE